MSGDEPRAAGVARILIGDGEIRARTADSSGFTKESLQTTFDVYEANDDFANAAIIPGTGV